MAKTLSTMMDIGTPLPDFNLPDFNGNRISSFEFKNEPLLVIFMCNHCPYVKHVIGKLSELARDYQARGVSVVAISANDADAYPADSPEKMKEFAQQHNLSFPYLYDEPQTTAKAFKAACTPEFFLFDSEHKLQYRGRMDGSTPGNDEPVTGEELTAAVDNLLDGKQISQEQTPSVGCNIKWKPGNEPDYF